MPKAEAIDRRTRLRIAAHLRQAMKERDLSAADVCRATGLAPSTISRMLNDDSRIGLDVVLAINRGLHIDANRLLNHDPPAEFFPPGHGPGPQGRKAGPQSDGSPYISRASV